MELILERGLEHQQKAITALKSIFRGVNLYNTTHTCENPTFDLQDGILDNNIRTLQSGIRPEFRGCRNDGEYLKFDIKMETGTGKTYVYTQAMYEFHKEYGFNKFIIVVPSLAIKAGIRQFLSDPYVKHHFSGECGYNSDIELGVLESPKKVKKGFLAMPGAIREFVTGSRLNTNKIYVLLVNMQLLTNGNMLTRSDYDYLVEGFSRPFDALRATKPIVFIDEPHRFSRGQKAYRCIEEELRPQIIARFGATFPEVDIGRGKNKVSNRDYNNLIYELNARDAFNHNLIKGVIKEHFESPTAKEEKVKLVTIESKASASFHLKRRGADTKSITLTRGDSLSLIDASMDGIEITGIAKNYIELSNGQIKYQGEEFDTDIYSSSYQEKMIQLALQRHFETERQNFSGRRYKIKSLALFFIDDISSYRYNPESQKEPYLKTMFEKLLKERIEETLGLLTGNEKEYREYLMASLYDIGACHAGYFAQDNNDSDEGIAQEVDDILHNKKRLIALRLEDGSWNTRRFLFSKWTLKEGWDNPNVFTIAKLRSSGSEISKLQEVGRGLRLPVDETGNRISNEEFYLNYIVDFTEADFAQKLVEEINGELPETKVIPIEKLDAAAEKRGMDPDDFFGELLYKKYIDRNRNIRSENREKFLEEFPDFATGINTGKIKDNNKAPARPVKIRKEVFDELKELWAVINQKYYLFYDADLNNEIPVIIRDILQRSVFGSMTLRSDRSVVKSDGDKMVIRENTGVYYTINRPLPYGEFLKRISSQTSIPITLLHAELARFSKENTISRDLFNEYTAGNIIKAFRDWKLENTRSRFKYMRSGQPVADTALTYQDGTVKDQIVQGRIGTKFIEGTPSEKYLYDVIVFDSPLEKENITTDIDEVIVYGKIPRSSIAIPTITGENYSPDFMYLVKKQMERKS